MIANKFMCSLIVLTLQMGVIMGQATPTNYSNVNQFSYNLHKAVVTKDTENLAFSPISVWMVLSMAAYGAEGETEKQMISGLGLDTDQSVRRAGGLQKSVYQALNSFNKSELAMVNAMFLDEQLEVKSSFISLTKSVYESEQKLVNFQDPRQTSKIMNDWVEEKTESKMKDFTNPNDFTMDTKLVLVNAMSFVGTWLHKFNPARTIPESFYFPSGEIKEIPTMNIRKMFRYGFLDDLGAKFIVLPYEKTEDMHESFMVVVCPDEYSNLSYIENNLEYSRLSEMLLADFEDVSLHLPKFKLESKTDLEPAMIKLGMAEMFRHSANFSGITNLPLRVGKFIQKITLEVDEYGASGASATAIEIESRRLSLDLSVNQPFLIFICTKEFVLFSGRILKPNY